MDEPLVWVRAVHFAATISLTGTVLFLALIAEPVFRGTHAGGEVPARVRSWLAWIEWGSLVVVVVSGAAWLILKAAQMGDVPWQAVFSEDLIPTVLWGTDFGQDWIARLVLAALLVPTLLAAQPARASYRPALVAACVLGAALVGTLAWAGHAAATTGAMGAANISSDILHLVAAAAWVGALVPLALLLVAALGRVDAPSIAIAREAVRRFSILGIVSVGTLVVTGVVNGLMIIGSLAVLAGTDYGRLLLFKIALFLAMLSLAAINRLWLTPLLQRQHNADTAAILLRRIGSNTVLEAVIGVVIVAIVGVLGTMSPTE